MARQPRPDLPDVAQHIVQRGNDRQPCCFTQVDYPRYLGDLRAAAQRYGVAVHGYVRMTNHVHLLATPRAAGAVAPKTGGQVHLAEYSGSDPVSGPAIPAAV